MSNKNLDVALRLYLEANGFNQGVRVSGQSYKTFTDNAARDTAKLDRLFSGLRSQITSIGAGIGFVQNQRLSGQLDKDLVQIRQTAGGTRQEMRQLREEIFAMARETGRPLDTLKGGFNNLIQAGLSWDAARSGIRAINPASAVTGASETVLSGGLTVAASSYGFDLAQAGIATRLLDQMTVAGRLGNAELEDLASIFARVGVNAKGANLQFEDTLGFVEALSKIERNPERLATLSDSTLRLFSNDTYKANASKATGVSFYNPDRSARNPAMVLDAIAEKYRALSDDMARDKFIARAFGKTDLDTQKGLRTLLSGDTLGQWRKISAEIRQASGTIERDLPEALDNAVDQASRLRLVMRQVGDEFAMPVNKAFADAINVGMEKKSKGGLELSNGELLGAGAGAFLIGGLLANVARSLPGKLMGGFGRAVGDTASTAIGVAQGKALEHMAGVTPVFVTNWPGGGSGGGFGAGDAAAVAGGAAVAAKVLKSFRLSGLGGVGLTGIAATNPMGMLGPAGAFLGGAAIGSYIYDKIDTTEFADRLGGTIATVLARWGNDQAARATGQPTDVSKVNLDIRLRQDGRLAVERMSSSPGVDLRAISGPMDFMGP